MSALWPVLLGIATLAITFPLYRYLGQKWSRPALVGLVLCLWVLNLGVSYAYGVLTWTWFAWLAGLMAVIIVLLLTRGDPMARNR